ncbi:unnamed protein product [Cochlearia groenlandica]
MYPGLGRGEVDNQSGLFARDGGPGCSAASMAYIATTAGCGLDIGGSYSSVGRFASSPTWAVYGRLCVVFVANVFLTSTTEMFAFTPNQLI